MSNVIEVEVIFVPIDEAEIQLRRQGPGKLIIGPWKSRWPQQKPPRRSPRRRRFVQLDLFKETR